MLKLKYSRQFIFLLPDVIFLRNVIRKIYKYHCSMSGERVGLEKPYSLPPLFVFYIDNNNNSNIDLRL